MTATATRDRPSPAPDSGQIEDQRSSDRRGLLRLGVIVVLIAALSMALDIGGAVIVVTAILSMIMLHEFGHFITARWAGMRVTDFYVGFGPEIWSIKRGDTRYGVRALPAGGYVKVIGMNSLEEIAPEDEPYTYRAKNYWQRLRFASAGSVMHFLIAFVLMVVLLAGFGIEDRDAPPTTTLDGVTKSFDNDGELAPAYAAGIRAGDAIVGINGQAVTTWKQVSDTIHDATGQQLQVTVDRDGRRFSVPVTPIDPRTAAQKKADGVERMGFVGIQPRAKFDQPSLPVAVWRAGFEVKEITVLSTEALFGLFTPESAKNYGAQLTRTGPADPEEEGNRLLSPVGIARIADASAERGVAQVLWLLIAINVFVGIFNMVPLPPFDGGHVAVATYEAIRSRITKRRYMADMNKLLPVAYAVVTALFLLSVSALWLDIVHPFKLG
jgi:membrane-associated protease RseP (regulator of RpoE activity)